MFEYIIRPFLQQTYILFSYTFYFYQHSIDFQINMAGKTASELKNTKL